MVFLEIRQQIKATLGEKICGFRGYEVMMTFFSFEDEDELVIWCKKQKVVLFNICFFVIVINCHYHLF